MEPTRLPRCFIPLMYGRALVIKYLFTVTPSWDRNGTLVPSKLSNRHSWARLRQDEVHAGPQVAGEPGSEALGRPPDARSVPAPWPFYQQAVDARRLGGREIDPAVADQPASRQIHSPLPGSGPDEPWLRLPAGAAVPRIVGADVDGVDGQGTAQRPVDLLDRVETEVPARDIGLIADHEQHVAGFTQPAEIRLRRGKDLQLGNRAGCRGSSTLHPDLIQHPVPVEKDGGASAVGHVLVEHSGEE